MPRNIVYTHNIVYHQQEEGPEATFGEKLESVRDPKHFESLVANTEKLVVDFYAPWCGKCRMIAPFVDELLAKHPDVTFVKFDTTADQLDTLSADLGVKGLPTFKLYKVILSWLFCMRGQLHTHQSTHT